MAEKKANKVETTVGAATVNTGDQTAAVVNAGEQTADKPVGEKAAAVKVDIIRGRMPLLIVAMIKFGTKEMTDGAVAAKFRTTNGKVSDIRKNRNFGYITEKFVPTQEMKDQAIAFAEQLEDKSVLADIKSKAVATAEQAAEFDALRKTSRPGRKAADKPAGAEKTAEVKTATPASAKKDAKPVSDDELASLTE